MSIAKIVAALVEHGEEDLAEELLAVSSLRESVAVQLSGPQSEMVYRKVLDTTKKRLSKFEDEILSDIMKQLPSLSRSAALSLRSELQVWHELPLAVRK